MKINCHKLRREKLSESGLLCVFGMHDEKKSQELIGNNLQDILLVVLKKKKSEKQDTLCMRLILHVGGAKRNR